MDEGSCAGFLRSTLRCQRGVQCYSQRSSPWASSLLQVAKRCWLGLATGRRAEVLHEGHDRLLHESPADLAEGGALKAKRAKRQMISENLPAVVVLEASRRLFGSQPGSQDDVRLVAGFSEKLEKLMKELPNDWEASTAKWDEVGQRWQVCLLGAIAPWQVGLGVGGFSLSSQV